MSNNRVLTFARRFFHTRNGYEAAIGAGIPPDRALAASDELLDMTSVKKELERLEKNSPKTMSAVRAGLARLAFGRVNDAVRLAFDRDLDPKQIKELDLFSVSAIKLQKDGAVEIKFADRQSALEKLAELSPEQDEASNARQILELIYGKTGSDTDDA
ncbi:MAG: terminase small subunit [Ruminococcus sp.]|nr:terminase small subunit [Ruminococcus sp.]